MLHRFEALALSAISKYFRKAMDQAEKAIRVYFSRYFVWSPLPLFQLNAAA